MKELTKIINRFSGELIFDAEVAGETESIRRGLAVKLGLEGKINLSYADLRNANLSNANLSNANLSYGDLSYAILRNANLSGSILRNADLRNADLSYAILRDADLSYANLSYAILRDAILRVDVKLVGSRPFLRIGPIGSRADCLDGWITDRGLIVGTANRCFFGTVQEFQKACRKTHGENEHYQEYMAALALIERHAELWTPKEETIEPAKEVSA